MNQRALLIGLDGGTFSILDELIAEGIMPCLSAIMASGARAELRSVIPPLTPPAWASLMTGQYPGNHGIFDFFRFDFENGRHLRVAQADDVRCETIWSIVSRHGLKATVLNFPLMFPGRRMSGYVVPGWVPWRYLRLACQPPGLYDDVKNLPGFNPRELAMDLSSEGKAIEGSQTEDDYAAWIELHIRRERQWFEIVRHLMAKDPCHLTAVLFDGVDKLQHVCWRFLDPECFSAHPSPWERTIRELCVSYFRQIDRFLGEIVGMAGPDPTILIASDHGFGRTAEVFYLNAWLEQHGYLTWADGDHGVNAGETLGLETMARRFYQVDWSRTTAHCPTPSSNGIYISVAGRGGKDGVPPEHYGRFRAQLADALRDFKDPVTGERVVTKIWTREEAFAGRCVGLAPDLTLALRDGGFVSVLPSDVALRPRPEPCGTHHPEGIFVAAGPGIRRGLSVSPLSIVDVAPMLLHLLGLPVPEDMQGRVPTELFETSTIRARPIVRGEPTRGPDARPGGEPGGLDETGESEVIRRLTALGYLE